MTGSICGVCKQPGTYVSGPTWGRWVHADTGRYIAATPVPHDINTHIVKPSMGGHTAASRPN